MIKFLNEARVLNDGKRVANDRELRLNLTENHVNV